MARPQQVDVVPPEKTPHAAFAVAPGDAQPIGNLCERERHAVGQTGQWDSPSIRP
jgi:hypothetical protein